MGQKGRTAKWVPRICNADDVVRGHVIMAAYTASGDISSILNKFQMFCRLNGFIPEAALAPWMGQMKGDHLSPGTIHQYVRSVVLNTGLRRSREARQALRVAEAFHTHKGGRGHARDISEEDALAIYSKAATDAEDHETQDALWILLVSGLRASCIGRLCEDSITLTPTALNIKLFFGKSVRRTRKRREIKIPRRGLPGPPRGFATRAAKKNNFLPKKTSNAILNKALSEAAHSLKKPKVTCGSFRRLFARRMKRLGLDVTEMMGHVSADMAKAYYLF